MLDVQVIPRGEGLVCQQHCENVAVVELRSREFPGGEFECFCLDCLSTFLQRLSDAAATARREPAQAAGVGLPPAS